MSLKNQVALITGAGRGIGKTITLELARQGAVVIGTDLNQEMADVISEYLGSNSAEGKGVVMDVTNQASIDHALEIIRKQYGSPSILINNAGITRDDLILRMKFEAWQAVIDTNLTAVFRVTKACLRDMLKARWGRIISISSMVGFTGNTGQANYAAAKAGVVAFSKSLAQEIASRNITVNVVAPGYIDTPMTQKLSDEQKQVVLNMIPTHTVGQPEDVAYAAAFLAAPEAKYITGQTIHVNGGILMN